MNGSLWVASRVWSVTVPGYDAMLTYMVVIEMLSPLVGTQDRKYARMSL